jgi:DNA-binding transcriptional LysR family regulator
MNLHQLRIFCNVVEQGSYTRAAEVLYMTQPAVSLQVRSLERSLQVKLLERANQHLIVTEAGQALYQCALPMLNAEKEAERVLAELKGAVRKYVPFARWHPPRSGPPAAAQAPASLSRPVCRERPGLRHRGYPLHVELLLASPYG